MAKKPEPPKRPMGRPTKYKPEYCDALIEHMANGYSFESFGATIGVARDAVFEWAKVHEEFSDAKSRALDKNLLWFEDQARKGMWTDKDGPQLNNTVWVFSMKNRHGWRDNKDLNVNARVADTTELEREKLRKMPMPELKKLVKGKLEEEDE